MSDKRSMIEQMLHDRLSIMKMAPDKIKELEKRIETAKMTPKELAEAQELLASLKRSAPRK